MPVDPICAALLICERVIADSVDGAQTVVRLIDVFKIPLESDIPVEKRPIIIGVLFTAKFPSGDDTAHQIKIYLERPNGEVLEVGESEESKAKSKFPTAPRGINVSARFGVFPKMMGTHYIIVVLDDRLTYRTPFTLVEAEAPVSVQTESQS